MAPRKTIKSVRRLSLAAISLSAATAALAGCAPNVPNFLLPKPTPMKPTGPPGVQRTIANTAAVYSQGCSFGKADIGSAWAYAPDHVVTASHVVGGGSDFTVMTPSGHDQSAKVVLFDPANDIAVLYVPGLKMQTLPLAPNSPSQGEQAYIVGYPGGKHEAMSSASMQQQSTEVVDPFNQSDTNQPTVDIFSFAADVTHGNSGGPIVDTYGQVVGLLIQGAQSPPTVIAVDINQIRADLALAQTATQSVLTGGQCVALG